MSFHLVFDFYPIRMKSRLFDLIVLLTGGLSMNEGNKYSCSNYTEVLSGVPSVVDVDGARCWMEVVNEQLKTENFSNIVKSVEKLERVLENTALNETTSIIVERLVAHIFRAEVNFTGLNISASQDRVTSDSDYVANITVKVHLPKELLKTNENNTIVFCMITSPEKYGPLGILDGRIVGLSVSKKTVLGLQDKVNFSMPLQRPTLESQADKQPSCQFFNFSTREFYQDGCTTEWKRDEGRVICSCDHLTYFAVLMVSPSISESDQEILSYITLIGCSLSLFFLVVTIVLYATQRGTGTDISLKVHINLSVALILLNLHFLPSQQVAALSSSGPCIYVAVLLHYSLLATFTWTAIEGFHLYLLLVRVFNIYVRRYLLKLSLVGWGFPAVIVIVIAIIDKDTYSRVTLHPTKTNGTAVEMCYLSNDVMKLVTTVGLFGLVFVFNLAMLVVTMRRLKSLRTEQTSREKGRARRDTCTVLGITCLLGITWGIIFFSFGQLTTPGLYLFCVLNSLQGFFIFLWFWVFKRKTEDRQPGSDTHSTNTGSA
ncbi:adhesion G-protein coupled receptor G5 isoform X1 [Salmo salar]|uniref:Adhesion G-protein coupled receptor G5-like isoform X1 n=3 Tax=Salmo salar TaxID=8030 RepID=A0ABM3E0L4_SALSA|nr:adhesion G-protein coupled receptor G5-like isoform X1 [Salmo salar]XP_045564595.1 adhesion G-protein coupled receptor G5-like isoform X1 [Salmo salar]XP_045564596.1 adhesion G-protein coupled receptor G5-like isoform X1 [Salmo salar]XP_045564597.1 adhesion G-protein coupled receptor G5-like isoform X1 [Salmo salar]XP_045564598.1 adhesion G-protein coupled receptor G5-like isoform X1 [Salmo salar]